MEEGSVWHHAGVAGMGVGVLVPEKQFKDVEPRYPSRADEGEHQGREEPDAC